MPPPSPPRDPSEETWYPPPRAFATYLDEESVLFFLDSRPYGFFWVVDKVKGTFKLKPGVNIDNLPDFLGECSKEPPTSSSSKAAVNLLRARPELNKHLPSRMNAKLEASPPAFTFTKPHPLSPTIIKNLNHHRESRSDLQTLQNAIKQIVVPESKTRFKAEKKPVATKVPGILALKAEAGIDPVIDFLNTPTTQAMSFVIDSHNLFGFLATPSLDLLAIHHHLKEQLLLMLAVYNGFSTLSLATQNVIKKGTFPEVDDCGMLCELQGNAQFSQFIYKSVGEIIENLAKQLGAIACYSG